MRLTAVVLVLGVGWVWGGSAGAALCLLWWRTPSFANAWSCPLPFWAGLKASSTVPSDGTSWLCPWFVLRRPVFDGSAPRQPNQPAFEMVYRDEVGAAEFARLRRECLGRAD